MPRSLPILALTGLFALFGPLIYAAHLGIVAGLAVLALVGTAASGWPRRAGFVGDFCALGRFVPLLLWMGASALWALDLEAAVSLSLRLGLILLAGALLWRSCRHLPDAALPSLLTAVVGGFCCITFLVSLDLAFGGRVSLSLHKLKIENFTPALFYGQGATIQAMLLVPLTESLWRAGAKRLAGVHLLLAIICILSTASLSAKTALAMGVLGYGGVWLLPQLRWALLGLLALAVVAAPLVMPMLTPDRAELCWLAAHKPSALHRLYIWRFVAQNIAERPVLGWGLDAARRLPGGHDRIEIRACTAAPDEKPVIDGEILPLHPHNAILQVWLELGGIGALLGFGALLLSLRQALTGGDRSGRAATAAGIIAGLSVTLVSFGLWQEWLDSSLLIVAAIMLVIQRQRARPDHSD